MNEERIIALARHIEQAEDLLRVEDLEELEDRSLEEVVRSRQPLKQFSQECWVTGECGCIAGHAVALWPDEAGALAQRYLDEPGETLPPPTGQAADVVYDIQSATLYYRVAKQLLGVGVDDAWWLFAPSHRGGAADNELAAERLRGLLEKDNQQPEEGDENENANV